MNWLLASRGRVFLSTLALLLVLDLGRSIYARWAYARPTSTWQPDPAVYADLTWPPGADLGPRASGSPSNWTGRVLWRRSACDSHGVRLSPRGRDYGADADTTEAPGGSPA